MLTCILQPLLNLLTSSRNYLIDSLEFSTQVISFPIPLTSFSCTGQTFQHSRRQLFTFSLISEVLFSLLFLWATCSLHTECLQPIPPQVKAFVLEGGEESSGFCLSNSSSFLFLNVDMTKDTLLKHSAFFFWY